MDRKDILIKAIKHADETLADVMLPLIENMIFLEARMEELKKLPFIRIHPGNSSMQKVTDAGKQYREMMQQYNGCIKIIISALGKSGESDTSSPFREWLKKQKEVF